MNWLDLNDAQTIGVLLSAVIIPFAVSWLKVVTWPAGYKFALAALLSLVAGFVSIYAAGQFNPEGTVIQNAAVILAAAQGVYYVAFKALGLERVLFPKQALVSEARSDVAEQVDAKVSTEKAKEILDSNVSTSLDVTANVVSNPSGNSVTV